MTERRKSSNNVTLQLVVDFNKAAIRHLNAGNIEKLHEYIRKLYAMPMKVSFLRDSEIEKTIKEVIRKHPDCEKAGKALLYKWKNLVVQDVIDRDPSYSNSPKVSDTKKIEFVPKIPDNLMSEEIANSIKNDLRADFNTYEASNEFSSSPSTESKSSSCRESDKSSSDESDKSSRPISKRKRDHESSKSSSKKTKYCSVVEIDHQSGTSFADALNMMESIPIKPKKIKKSSPKLDETVHNHTFSVSTSMNKGTSCSSTSSTSSTSTSTSVASTIRRTIYGKSILPARTQKLSDSDSGPENTAQQKNHFLENVTTSKSNRTKVYSGLRHVITKIPSLTAMCTQVLRENINNIEYTGGVPYLIMKPIIEQADPEQLKNIEYHNPYLIEDTDELWERFCLAQFRDKSRQYVNKMLKWRDIYFQCCQDREDKLKSVAANIKKSIDNAAPTKQAKLALIDPVMPRFKRGKELSMKPITTASQKLVTKKNAENVSAIVPAPQRSQMRSASCNNNIVKPKTGPLMQKVIRILKTQSR